VKSETSLADPDPVPFLTPQKSFKKEKASRGTVLAREAHNA
jgi:hypothetical protein